MMEKMVFNPKLGNGIVMPHALDLPRCILYLYLLSIHYLGNHIYPSLLSWIYLSTQSQKCLNYFIHLSFRGQFLALKSAADHGNVFG